MGTTILFNLKKIFFHHNFFLQMEEKLFIKKTRKDEIFFLSPIKYLKQMEIFKKSMKIKVSYYEELQIAFNKKRYISF